MKLTKLAVVGLVLVLSGPVAAGGSEPVEKAATGADEALMAEALSYEQEYRRRMATLYRLREIAKEQHRTPRLKSLDRMSERVHREHEKVMQAVAKEMTPEGRERLQKAISSKQDQATRRQTRTQRRQVRRVSRAPELPSREQTIELARTKISADNASAEYDRMCKEIQSIVHTTGTRPRKNTAVGKSSNTISVKLPKNCRGPDGPKVKSSCRRKVVKVTRRACSSRKSCRR